MRVRVNDVDLYVDIEGAQRRIVDGRWTIRPTVLVLHGGPGFDQGYLRPGLAALGDVAQVVFVDLRAQGRSGPAPLATCTLEQMADDIAALIEELGLAETVVFGHSAGGFVALHLALRHPGAARALILCDTASTLARVPDTAPPPGLEQRAPESAVQIAQAMFAGDYSPERVSAFMQSVMPYYAGPDHEEIPAQIMPLSRFHGEVAQHFFSDLAAGYDLRARLPEIPTPTLVVVGEHDWVCPPVHSRILAARLPTAHLEIITGAGHFPFSEEPTQFAAAVDDFLGRNTPSPAPSEGPG
jgi:proline iminopeptidase